MNYRIHDKLLIYNIESYRSKRRRKDRHCDIFPSAESHQRRGDLHWSMRKLASV